VTDQTVGEVQKRGGEVIKVCRKQYRGHDLVDVRVYIAGGAEDGGDQPTRKGLCCSPERWRRLLPLVEQALEET